MTIIYIVGAIGVGFIFGAVFEAFVDTKQIRRLTAKNVELETENTLLKGHVKPETVEVIHKHVIENNSVADVDYSQNW